MYQTALLTSGFELENPQDFASRIYSMMSENLGGAAPSAAAPASSASSTVVEPQVIVDDKADPWGKN